jgi:DNA-binding transcriptional LysR family regulator
LLTRRLGAEPKVAVMSSGHRLAARRSLRQRDLAGEVLVDRDRRCTSVEATLELAASGREIAVVPRSIARIHTRPGLVTRRIVDREPLGIHLVTAADARPRVRAFFDVAVEVLGEAVGGERGAGQGGGQAGGRTPMGGRRTGGHGAGGRAARDRRAS